MVSHSINPLAVLLVASCVTLCFTTTLSTSEEIDQEPLGFTAILSTSENIDQELFGFTATLNTSEEIDQMSFGLTTTLNTSEEIDQELVESTTSISNSEETDQELLCKLATANNDLGVNLYRMLTYNSSANIIISPMSLSITFGMLYYGTQGQTAKELRKVLGYDTADLPDELVHQTFQKFLSESLPRNQDPSDYVLKAANVILLDTYLNMVPSYKNAVQDLYQASVQYVDFKEGPDVIRNVNIWVRENTNRKIKKLLNQLDPSAALVLLNAVYFKGTWKKQFKARITRREKFYNNGLENMAKKVPMMRIIEEFPYTVAHNAQIIELPYKGDNISMLIFLPDSLDGLENLEKDLTLENLSDITKQLSKTKVYLNLPKFKIKYLKEMSSDFQNLGAYDAFHSGANFSGLATDKRLCVSVVLHKAFVEINEEGSEAAAVTATIQKRKGNKHDITTRFIADHPFMFAIVDKRNFMILFLGSVKRL